jgi:ribonuclease P/MRP protein subunit POP5
VTLPKHLRPRWRYLAVAVESWPDAAMDRRAFQRATWRAGRALLGDPGSADADLRVLRFGFDRDRGAGEAVVRVRRGEVDRARAAVACVSTVAGHPVSVHVRGTSGTVRACVDGFLTGPVGDPPASDDDADDADRATEQTVVFDGQRRSAVVRGDRVDLRDGDSFTGATAFDAE